MEETFEALAQLKEEGKFFHLESFKFSSLASYEGTGAGSTTRVSMIELVATYV